MGLFQGNHWDISIKYHSEGSTALKEERELIWPIKVVRRQVLRHVGERKEYEPALITCEGSCSGDDVTWTFHECVSHASYKCVTCGNVRRWGFDRWR